MVALNTLSLKDLHFGIFQRKFLKIILFFIDWVAFNQVVFFRFCHLYNFLGVNFFSCPFLTICKNITWDQKSFSKSKSKNGKNNEVISNNFCEICWFQENFDPIPLVYSNCRSPLQLPKSFFTLIFQNALFLVTMVVLHLIYCLTQVPILFFFLLF